MTPPASITEKESLKENYNTLNYSFQLYNAHSFSQKYEKQHFVMLLPSLGKEQHKMNNFFFQKDLISQNFYKNKGPYFCFVFFFFNFLLKREGMMKTHPTSKHLAKKIGSRKRILEHSNPREN